MANGKQPPKTPLTSIPGGKAPGRKQDRTRKVNLAIWRQMEEYWLKIDRSPSRMAAKFGISEKTAGRIVHTGMPSIKRRPLRVLAEEYDTALSDYNAVEMEAQFKAEADEFSKVKRANLQAAKNTKGIIALVQNELILRYHNQGDRPLKDETTATGLPKLVSLAKQMAQALKDLGEYEMKWLNGAKPEDDSNVGDTPFGKLTDEQIKHVADTGRLPDGLDIDAFYKGLGMTPQQG